MARIHTRKLSFQKLFRLCWIIVRTIIVIGICFIILYPLFMKVSITLRSTADVLDPSIVYLPKHITLENFIDAGKVMGIFGTIGFNTLLVSTLAGLLHVVSCTMVGYGLARFEFPLKKFWLFAVILTLAIPPQVIAAPISMHFRNFDILGIFQLILGHPLAINNSPVAMFLLYATANCLKSGLYIFIIMQFFKSMPIELEEAAYVDGAGFWKTLTSIMLPSARVMMVTIFLFTFVWQWTDVYYSGTFLRDFPVLSSIVTTVGSLYSAQYGSGVFGSSPMIQSQLNNAGSLIFLLPLLIIYLFCNKYFVQGVERSGIVG